MKKDIYHEIKDFAVHNCKNTLIGTRLQALYRLIQYKGEPMQTTYEKMQGVKVLKISECEYIGFLHTPMKKNSFFPCKLQTIFLKTL